MSFRVTFLIIIWCQCLMSIWHLVLMSMWYPGFDVNMTSMFDVIPCYILGSSYDVNVWCQYDIWYRCQCDIQGLISIWHPCLMSFRVTFLDHHTMSMYDVNLTLNWYHVPTGHPPPNKNTNPPHAPAWIISEIYIIYTQTLPLQQWSSDQVIYTPKVKPLSRTRDLARAVHN